MKLLPAHIDAIREALPQSVIKRLRRRGLFGMPLAQLTEDQRDELYDAANEAWTNDAPEILTLFGCGSFGAFPLVVRGVPGAYFYWTAEVDDHGPFATAEEAERGARTFWCPGLYETEEAAEDAAREAGWFDD